MSKNKEPVTSIPTWTIYGTRSVGVEVHNTGKNVYVGALTVFLDDGEEDDANDKVITIASDIVCDTAEDCAYELANNIATLFQNINNSAFVINSDGDILNEINLDELFESRIPKKKKSKVSIY